MKWTAEGDLVVGVAFGSGKRRIGVGFGIGRRRNLQTFGIDLGEELLRRCFLFFLKGTAVSTWNWSKSKRHSVYVDRESAMKRSNVMNLLLQMMPSAQQISSPAAPSSPATTAPDHWSFLEEVDAPQWVDLVHEATLMGTLGDDPWFYRSHAHHETSLARIASVAIAANNPPAAKEKLRRPSKEKVPAQEKGPASKGKASSKAHVVKACLGGMQRVSAAGLKDGRLSGRLSSSRPRVTLLTTSQTWPRTPKKVHIQRPLQKRIAAAVAAGPDSSRLPVYDPSSNGSTPKKSYEGKIGHLRRVDSSVKNNVQEVRKTVLLGGTGRNSQGSDQPVTPGTGRSSQSSSVNAFESPKPTLKLYRLPSPPNQESIDPASPPDGLIIKSSPSDMNFSSDASPTTSSLSPESVLAPFRNEGRTTSVHEIVPAEEEGKESLKLQLAGSSSELNFVSHPAANYTHVEVNEPYLEISSFKDRDGDGDEGDGEVTSLHTPDWVPQVSTTMPRLRTSRSFNPPPMRVKEFEKVGSSSLKKKGSPTSRLLIHSQDVVLSDKQLIGAQATHPILEKLRRSWGSALRVKQRQDAELSGGDPRSDSSCQNSSAVEQKVASSSGALPNQCSESILPEKLAKLDATVYCDTNNANLGVKKEDNSLMHWEIQRRAQSGGEVPQSSSSEGQVLVIRKDTRSERPFQSSTGTTIQVPDLTAARSSGLSVIGTSGKLSKSKSLGTVDLKTWEKPSLAAPAAKSSSLAKIQANHQRSKSEMNLKFKKQYPHAETGVSKSVPLKGNKENLDLDVGIKVQKSVSPGLERKRKMQNYVRSSMPTSSVRQVVGVSSAALPVTVIRTSPQARTVATNRTGLGCCRPTTLIGQEAADSSRKSSESLDRKLNNLAVLRGSTSSLLKLTKQKSEKLSPTFSKEATNVGSKGCKSAVQVADDAVALSAEDRKSRIAPKYEPRLHSVKAIREWETKSGRRYYDLQPGERQKANQEITAATKTVTKRTSA